VRLAFPAGADGWADALVFWFFICAWIVVLSLLFFLQLPRAFRDARRIISRVMKLINNPPLEAELAKAEADSRRLNAALDRVPALQGRAQAAIATIRTTPLIPPAIGQVVRRIRAEYRAFRRELR
jgi:hypothetical protein